MASRRDFDSNQFLALLKYISGVLDHAASERILGLLLVGGLLDFPHKLGEALGERWLWGVVLLPQPASD
jgi:hypothetical protein